MSYLHDRIVFVDEKNRFIRTKKFADAGKCSDNYFVIICRDPIYDLPYSIKSVFELRESTKYQNEKDVCNEMYALLQEQMEIDVGNHALK